MFCRSQWHVSSTHFSLDGLLRMPRESDWVAELRKCTDRRAALSSEIGAISRRYGSAIVAQAFRTSKCRKWTGFRHSCARISLLRNWRSCRDALSSGIGGWKPPLRSGHRCANHLEMRNVEKGLVSAIVAQESHCCATAVVVGTPCHPGSAAGSRRYGPAIVTQII